jgi:hypothetical protein
VGRKARDGSTPFSRMKKPLQLAYCESWASEGPSPPSGLPSGPSEDHFVSGGAVLNRPPLDLLGTVGRASSPGLRSTKALFGCNLQA